MKTVGICMMKPTYAFLILKVSYESKYSVLDTENKTVDKFFEEKYDKDQDREISPVLYLKNEENKVQNDDEQQVKESSDRIKGKL